MKKKKRISKVNEGCKRHNKIILRKSYYFITLKITKISESNKKYAEQCSLYNIY